MLSRIQPPRASYRFARRSPLAIAASIAVLLAGCATPQARSPDQLSQSPPRRSPLGDPGGSRPVAWRIAQQRIGTDSTFLLVATELRPTPKTLAAGGDPLAPRAMAVPASVASSASARGLAVEPTRAPHAVQTRVREPVGSVYFAPAGARVSPAALPTVATAVARTGRADRLVLTAYTDPYGSLELNRRLADLRAESVTAALAARGVDPAQVIVLSRPQCCATQPLPDYSAAPYRRVDIEILTHRRVLSEERSDDAQHHT